MRPQRQWIRPRFDLRRAPSARRLCNPEIAGRTTDWRPAASMKRVMGAKLRWVLHRRKVGANCRPGSRVRSSISIQATENSKVNDIPSNVYPLNRNRPRIPAEKRANLNHPCRFKELAAKLTSPHPRPTSSTRGGRIRILEMIANGRLENPRETMASIRPQQPISFFGTRKMRQMTAKYATLSRRERVTETPQFARKPQNSVDFRDPAPYDHSRCVCF
jgi:hypothetical protein